MASGGVLRFSQSHLDSTGLCQSVTGTSGDVAIDNSSDARHVLVSDACAMGDLHFPSSSRDAQPAPAALAVSSPVSGATIFWLVRHQLPRLTTQGYSRDVLSQLLLSRVASSNRTYKSKWKLFASYSSSRNIDTFAAPPAQVADFLF